MEEINRKKVWLTLAIVLMGVGTFFLTILGIIPIWNAEHTNINEQIKIPSSTIGLSGGQVTRILDITTQDNFLRVTVTFSSNILFVGDKVSWDASAFAMKPTDIFEIVIFIVSPTDQVSKSYSRLDVLHEQEKHPESTIILTPHAKPMPFCEPICFAPVGANWVDVSELGEGDKTLHIFELHKNSTNVEDELDSKSDVLTIYPDAERLQIETNIFTLEQIQASQKQFAEQNKTDKEIVALSYTAVTLAPILIGSDILLRIYLEPYTNDMKNESRHQGDSHSKHSRRNLCDD